jgi:TPR repeat protein
MYSTGKGVPKDDVESAAWYRKAAEQNEVNSQRILGSLYAAGQGVPQDFVQAYAWIKVAATPEDPAAQKQLMKYAEQLTAEQRAAAEKAAGEVTASIHQRRNR